MRQIQSVAPPGPFSQAQTRPCNCHRSVGRQTHRRGNHGQPRIAESALYHAVPYSLLFLELGNVSPFALLSPRIYLPSKFLRRRERVRSTAGSPVSLPEPKVWISLSTSSVHESICSPSAKDCFIQPTHTLRTEKEFSVGHLSFDHEGLSNSS